MSEYLGENLIFLISQPRAGSTLLQTLCSNHPHIATSAEPWLMLHLVYALKAEGISAEYDAKHAHNALVDFLALSADGEKTYYSGIRAMVHVLYGKAIEKSQKKFFLDKTPRYYSIIPELYEIFPRAKFIFLVRNPLSVLSSILFSWAHGYWPQLAKNREDLITAPEKILDGIKLLGDDAIVVRYEELVSHPESELKRLCKQIGIEYDSSMASYMHMDKAAGRMGDSVGIVQHNKPCPTNQAKWMRLLENKQTLHFTQAYLTELGEKTVSGLGYSYGELAAQVGLTSPCVGSFLPWKVAIKRKKEKTWFEKKYTDYIMKMQKTPPRGKLLLHWLWLRFVSIGLKIMV
ncbi:MAG: sulfotransferase [Candidatus Electrothrix sp. GW3-4]|uniref:sulfotransferase family protein n=1 Tax=Candidatus Electrothrix sp. GW3-4 TaxID=3126740 RepID=UPI0030CB3F12